MAVDPNSASATDRAIAQAQQRLTTDTTDDNARVTLAAAFLQKARETADPTLYGKADGLLNAAEKTQDKTDSFWITRGTLRLAQHAFAEGLEDGKQALSINPQSSAAYGVVVDANNELGRDDEALIATQAMLDLRPDLPALSRASYARELRGDTAGAIQLMNQAIVAGGTAGGENIAYVQTLLGGLLLNSGDFAGADRAFMQALAAFPDFAAARAGQAQVLLAYNRLDESTAILDGLLQRQPLEAYAVAHGDVLALSGKTAEAERAYALVDVINRLFTANGVDVDRESALFLADHRSAKDAEAQARKAVKDRGSPAGHDVLAWALFKEGDERGARSEIESALRLGTRDPLTRFHAAAIYAAAGDTSRARDNLQIVLSGNPWFSGNYWPEVQRLAQELQLTVPSRPSAS